jgi:hypothetical protein
MTTGRINQVAAFQRDAAPKAGLGPSGKHPQFQASRDAGRFQGVFEHIKQNSDHNPTADVTRLAGRKRDFASMPF